MPKDDEERIQALIEIQRKLEDRIPVAQKSSNKRIKEIQSIANPSRNGKTPLHDAAEKGHTNVVRELLENCNTKINATNSMGRTPLMVAVMKGHFPIVQALLKNGAKTRIKETSTSRTAYDFAIARAKRTKDTNSVRISNALSKT